MDMTRLARWVRRVATGAAVVAVWTALWLARPPRATREPAAPPSPPGGTAPLVAGTSTFCPGGTYAGYRSARVFVPPNYPGPTPGARPARCYDSATEAIRAGLHEAPPPAGDEVVEGIYLVPTTPGLRTGCRRAARALGFAVPCPTRLPNPAFGEPPARCGTAGGFLVPTGSTPSCVVDVGPLYQRPLRPVRHIRAFVVQEGGFAAPPGYGPTGGNPNAAITVIGARARDWTSVRDAVEGCERWRLAGRTKVGRRRATIQSCGAQFALGGAAGALLVERSGDLVYAVAAIGALPANEALLEAIAGRLASIEPS